MGKKGSTIKKILLSYMSHCEDSYLWSHLENAGPTTSYRGHTVLELCAWSLILNMFSNVAPLLSFCLIINLSLQVHRVKLIILLSEGTYYSSSVPVRALISFYYFLPLSLIHILVFLFS